MVEVSVTVRPVNRGVIIVTSVVTMTRIVSVEAGHTTTTSSVARDRLSMLSTTLVCTFKALPGL